MESVGIIIIARSTNNFLLLHRAKPPIVWSTLTGKMEKGEKPMESIKREIQEEIGVDPATIHDIKKVGETEKPHHIMVGYVDNEFGIPNLKLDENDDYGWFNESNLPSPIHPQWEETFQYVKPILYLRETLKIKLNKLLNG